MNLLADESIDRPIVDRLRQEGHSVLYVAEMQPGTKDDEVLAEANRLSALLLTADKDFGELVFRMRQVTAGVILVRLSGLTVASKVETVEEALRTHANALSDSFTVISPGMVRIRSAI